MSSCNKLARITNVVDFVFTEFCCYNQQYHPVIKVNRMKSFSEHFTRKKTVLVCVILGSLANLFCLGLGHTFSGIAPNILVGSARDQIALLQQSSVNGVAGSQLTVLSELLRRIDEFQLIDRADYVAALILSTIVAALSVHLLLRSDDSR